MEYVNDMDDKIIAMLASGDGLFISLNVSFVRVFILESEHTLVGGVRLVHSKRVSIFV